MNKFIMKGFKKNIRMYLSLNELFLESFVFKVNFFDLFIINMSDNKFKTKKIKRIDQ
jgi:hypothetical protein